MAFYWDYVFENGTYLSVVSESPYIGVERKLPIQEMKLFSPGELRRKVKGEVGVKIFSYLTKSYFSSDKRNLSCTAHLFSLPSMSITLNIRLHIHVYTQGHSANVYSVGSFVSGNILKIYCVCSFF